ncbi:MAG: hypothetical protein A2029_14450 [Chloroflexi bacterium RBG_19FT_COMBO_47_9]|nr:MAG: hypothetical protein A2029_14450 [Chloroflexi bacterium RBG_19FT_COMBO_47_9]
MLLPDFVHYIAMIYTIMGQPQNFHIIPPLATNGLTTEYIKLTGEIVSENNFPSPLTTKGKVGLMPVIRHISASDP